MPATVDRTRTTPKQVLMVIANPAVSTTLGTNGVHPLEMAQAYSVLANNGVLKRATIVTKIVDRETGEVMDGEVPAGSVVVAGSLPSKGGVNLYCAVIVKRVDAQTRSKTSITSCTRLTGRKFDRCTSSRSPSFAYSRRRSAAPASRVYTSQLTKL